MAELHEGVGSSQLDSLYGADYFFGKTSGYPPQGYALGHPDWTPWLDLIQQLVPGGRMLDLGCAYGYLVEEARARGFAAYGFDISSYALRQEPKVMPYLTQAELGHLPLRDQSAEVVCLFDVLEHLPDPLMALRESARVLAPEGLLIGSTPDPIHFSADEATHIFERPPSFWVDALRQLGFTVQFRFSVEAFNFQFVAARTGSATTRKLGIFQHDYFSPEPDFVEVDGELEILPRSGWGRLAEDSRQLHGSPALIYLLNSSRTPQRCRLRLQLRHNGGFGTVRVRFNSLVYREIVLTSEQTVMTVDLPDILVPLGGHHLCFDQLTPGQGEVFVGPLQAHARPSASARLVEGLPFDLYQRYRFAAQVCEIVRPDSVLDVGGYLGDESGHLATTSDFLAPAHQPASLATTDLRQGDFPHHAPASAWEQPFPDRSFELVMSMDVLEHLPQPRRLDFLGELDRVAQHWILLGAPCDSASVTRAEEELAAGLMQTQSFLQEHRQLGLPQAETVKTFFESRGYQVLTFPNGYLPRWTALQSLTQLFFSWNDAELFQDFNRLYNRECYRWDLREPAYRTVFLTCKRHLSKRESNALQGLIELSELPSLERLLLCQPAFLQLLQRTLELGESKSGHWRDTQFLINERQKLIGLQRQEIAALRQELEHTPLWKLAHRRWKQKNEA